MWVVKFGANFDWCEGTPSFVMCQKQEFARNDFFSDNRKHETLVLAPQFKGSIATLKCLS